MSQYYYSKEQAEALHRLRDAAGGAKFDAAWTELVTELRTEMESGGDPRGERAQALARRWKGLIQSFTGGDAATERLLYVAAEKYRIEQRLAGTPAPDVVGYIQAAAASLTE